MRSVVQDGANPDQAIRIGGMRSSDEMPELFMAPPTAGNLIDQIKLRPKFIALIRMTMRIRLHYIEVHL